MEDVGENGDEFGPSGDVASSEGEVLLVDESVILRADAEVVDQRVEGKHVQVLPPMHASTAKALLHSQDRDSPRICLVELEVVDMSMMPKIMAADETHARAPDQIQRETHEATEQRIREKGKVVGVVHHIHAHLREKDPHNDSVHHLAPLDVLAHCAHAETSDYQEFEP